MKIEELNLKLNELSNRETSKFSVVVAFPYCEDVLGVPNNQGLSYELSGNRTLLCSEYVINFNNNCLLINPFMGSGIVVLKTLISALNVLENGGCKEYDVLLNLNKHGFYRIRDVKLETSMFAVVIYFEKEY